MIVIVSRYFHNAQRMADQNGIPAECWYWVCAAAADRWLARCASLGAEIPPDRILTSWLPERWAA